MRERSSYSIKKGRKIDFLEWIGVMFGFMSDRDIEKNVSTEYFVSTLRRLADALERKESFKIQVQNERIAVPEGAELVIEHEVEAGNEELSFELKWKK